MVVIDTAVRIALKVDFGPHEFSALVLTRSLHIRLQHSVVVLTNMCTPWMEPGSAADKANSFLAVLSLWPLHSFHCVACMPAGWGMQLWWRCSSYHLVLAGCHGGVWSHVPQKLGFLSVSESHNSLGTVLTGDYAPIFGAHAYLAMVWSDISCSARDCRRQGCQT